MAREFFCAYHSILEAMEPLNDAECGRLFRACLNYSMTGAPQELCGNERFVFPGLKAQIDRDIKSIATLHRSNPRTEKKADVLQKPTKAKKPKPFLKNPKKPKRRKRRRRRQRKRKINITHSKSCA